MERTQVHGGKPPAWHKTKPSTKAHEVVRKGGRYDHVVFVGSRSACNRYWVSQPDSENYVVRVVTDTRW
jgi:hypothetical protein